ncbi:MAG TPA: universal stress protein [Syntrophaceae bacterium]|jgi:nucleotide-binding universal stress UspA family protein|nr:universal stress protein [Syntrophaceae bacterium]
MLPLKKILYPTDFSTLSYEALKVACEYAKQFSAELCLLHVTPLVPAITAFTPSSTSFNVPLYQENLEKSTKEKLLKVVEKNVPKDMHAQVFAVSGNAGDEIVRFAEKENVDLIVIASHGESGGHHYVMGCVAEKIVRHAKCPVLTVPSLR